MLNKRSLFVLTFVFGVKVRVFHRDRALTWSTDLFSILATQVELRPW